MRKPWAINVALSIILLLLYGYIAYGLERYETPYLFASYFTLFSAYLYVVWKADDNTTLFWLGAAILFRALLVAAVPDLSDDFYRFIWDGRLWAAGHHPFAEIPNYYVTNHVTIAGIDEALLSHLNSPDYFTIYPPVAQFIFWIAVKLSPESVYGSVLVMKTIIFLAEVGSLLVIRTLLQVVALPAKQILLYALNPLVILELVGNIHLEAVLIFFLLLSILLLYQSRVALGGIVFSAAICVKLIPLIFLPAMLPALGWKKTFLFYLVIGITSIVLFIPLWDKEIIAGFHESLAYYFGKFEFNASIYYLVRKWGFWYYGYNIIQSVGWKLGLISFLIILFISLVGVSRALRVSPAQRSVLNNRPLMSQFVLILMAYFLFTTTLHPWYITTLLALSIFTSFQFVVPWTALIFLTYAGYSKTGFDENLAFTAVEYVVILCYFSYEFIWKRKYLSLLPS